MQSSTKPSDWRLPWPKGAPAGTAAGREGGGRAAAGHGCPACMPCMLGQHPAALLLPQPWHFVPCLPLQWTPPLVSPLHPSPSYHSRGVAAMDLRKEKEAVQVRKALE